MHFANVQADTVLLNGFIYHGSADPASRPSAMAVKGGQIVYVGDDESVRCFIGSGTDAVDLAGKYVFPGMIDGHIHPFALGSSLQEVDCGPDFCRSIQELQKRLKNAASQLPEGEWLIGYRLDERRFAEKRLPHRFELDVVSENRPIGLRHFTAELWVFNSAALQLFGLHDQPAEREPVEGMGIDAGGKLNGVLKGKARFMYAQPVLTASRSFESEVTRLSRSLGYLNSLGITTVADASLRSPDQLRVWQEARRRELQTVRVQWCVRSNFLDNVTAAGIQTGFGDAWQQFGPAKLFLDGLGDGGTIRSKPGTNSTSMRREVRDFCLRAAEAGFNRTFHAFGDAAVEEALDGLETTAALQTNRAAPVDRIEHACLTPPDIIRRFKKQRVGLMMNPTFLSRFGQPLVEYWGPERAAWFYPVAALLEAGVMLGAGSDGPNITPVDPLLGISLLTRRCWREPDGERYLSPEQAISRQQALDLYTDSNARLLGRPDLGRLAVGFRADYTVWQEDLLTADGDLLLRLKPLQTVIGGITAYSAGKTSR